MHVALISSRQDEAGRNIRDHILAMKKERDGEEVLYSLHEVEGRLITQDGIDMDLSVDLIIFLSRHTSTHPAPLLSVHVTGNFSRADLGGKPYSFPPASPLWMRSVFRSLVRYAPPGYRVTYEVTHHGPTEIITPSFFVEIGSTAEEWKDPRAGQAVAASVLSARPEPALPLLGIGGNHYATRATEMARQSTAAFGHLVHSREAPFLDLSLVRLLVERSLAEGVYIDKKDLPPAEVRRIEGILDEIGLPVLTEGEMRTLNHLSWQAFLALHRCSTRIAPGSRLVVHRMTGEGIPVVVHLDAELLTEALHTDRNAVMKELQDLPVAHIAASDGTPLPRFLAFEGDQSNVINHLIRLCVKIIVGNQKTLLEGDSLIIHRMRFDPQKARELGIPQGPLYGMLSAGHAIEKNGRMITPEMVQTETRKILHIPGLGRYV